MTRKVDDMLKRFCDFCKDETKSIDSSSPANTILLRKKNDWSSLSGSMNDTIIWDICDNCIGTLPERFQSPGRSYNMPPRPKGK